MTFEHCALGEICNFIDYRGKTPEKTTAGIPLITAKIVKNGFIQRPEEFIAEEAYDPAYGARPVKRYVQKHIENEIAKMVISGDVVNGSTVSITAEEGKLRFIAR